MPETDAEKENLRETLIGTICYSYSYYGYVYDYPAIVSDAYTETFTENGTAYDLAPYFHTYINNTDYGFMELDVGEDYVLTYYADENGNPGALTGEQIEKIVAKIESAKADMEVVVEMGDATIISKEILEAAKKKGVILVLQMDGYTWKIGGSEIASAADVDFKVTLNTTNISEQTVAKVAGDNKKIQLSLAHEGALGFEAELQISVGADYAGKTGTLYYYNPDKSALEKRCSGKVSKKGEISLQFVHASDYVLVFEETAPVIKGEISTDGGTKKDDSAEDTQTAAARFS